MSCFRADDKLHSHMQTTNAADIFCGWLTTIAAKSLTRFDDTLTDPTAPLMTGQHPSCSALSLATWASASSRVHSGSSRCSAARSSSRLLCHAEANASSLAAQGGRSM